jgi:hypothetical protein
MRNRLRLLRRTRRPARARVGTARQGEPTTHGYLFTDLSVLADAGEPPTGGAYLFVPHTVMASR